MCQFTWHALYLRILSELLPRCTAWAVIWVYCWRLCLGLSLELLLCYCWSFYLGALLNCYLVALLQLFLGVLLEQLQDVLLSLSSKVVINVTSVCNWSCYLDIVRAATLENRLPWGIVRAFIGGLLLELFHWGIDVALALGYFFKLSPYWSH